MPYTNSSPTSPSTQSPTQRYAGPIWTLLLLAPFLAEVLSGSTRLSYIFVYIPEVMVWGGGALLCRELARRWRAGGTSLLLLGLALSVAEEFVIQQTSLAPLPFIGANAAYGRLWGVNWVYFLFLLGFESLWVVMVPVQITELVFPRHRHHPWLRARGLIVTCIVFLIGCRIAWYGWTQHALKQLNAPAYNVPLSTIAVGIGTILLLIWLAWLLRTHGHAGRSLAGKPIPAWIAAVAALIFAAAWFELIGLVFSPHPAVSASIAMASGILWALLALALFSYLSAASGWSDIHRWALCFGVAMGGIVMADVSSAGWSRLDLASKYVFQLFALIGLLFLGLRAAHRNEHGSIDA